MVGAVGGVIRSTQLERGRYVHNGDRRPGPRVSYGSDMVEWRRSCDQ